MKRKTRKTFLYKKVEYHNLIFHLAKCPNKGFERLGQGEGDGQSRHTC